VAARTTSRESCAPQGPLLLVRLTLDYDAIETAAASIRISSKRSISRTGGNGAGCPGARV